MVTQKAVYDWSTEHEKLHPYYTGVLSYEDLSMLNQLPKVHLSASASASLGAGGQNIRVQIHNPSNNLAFQIHLTVVDQKSGDEILPVLWEDNYFSLVPGESRAVVAHYDSPPKAGHLRLEIGGWNIDARATVVEGAMPN